MKGILALFGLFLIFAGISFAEDDTNYTHYCYRVCCLSLDATYTEGPPQQCVGPRATGNEVQNCVDQCLYELGAYYEANEDPTYVTVDQTSIGETYVPPEETPEEATAGDTNEDIQPDETNEENPGTPLIEEETSGSSASNGNTPLPEKTGGLCPLAFLLLLPLFIRK
jgi:hypothetical protein